MSDLDQETLADIVADIRERAENAMRNGERLVHNEAVANMLTFVADRIEAAAKRDEERAVEHATRHAEAVARDNCRDCVHNPSGKNYEGGNAAAMREACQKMLDLLMLRGDGKVRCVLTWDEFNESQKMLRIALSVGTPEEQEQRFGGYCYAEVCKRKKCKTRAKALFIDACALAWAQTPYKAEEGGL